MRTKSGTAPRDRGFTVVAMCSNFAGLALASWALLLAGCGDSGPPTDPDPGGNDDPQEITLAAPPPDGSAAASTITAGELEALLGVMAHDSMMGRASPSPELVEVALWAQSGFAAAGLEPAGEEGFLQWFLASPEDTADAVNVVALLRGSDPDLAGEYVVIGAHFDHVGIRSPIAGDSIYNGADDNGSGTVAVLELAQAFASLDEAPPRSILFVLFSAEERGLLGSHHYARSHIAPVGSMVAMINLDMIGRNWRHQIAGIHQPESGIFERADMVADAHPELDMDLIDDPWPGQNLVNRSDQAAFIPYGIPVLFLHSGTHEDYHMPSDEVEWIDYEKTERITRLIFWIGWELAATDRPPGFTQ